jgi:hypothetical protein
MASGHTLTCTDPLDAEPTFPFHPRSTLDTELTALIVGSIGTDLIDSWATFDAVLMGISLIIEPTGFVDVGSPLIQGQLVINDYARSIDIVVFNIGVTYDTGTTAGAGPGDTNFKMMRIWVVLMWRLMQGSDLMSMRQDDLLLMSVIGAPFHGQPLPVCQVMSCAGLLPLEIPSLLTMWNIAPGSEWPLLAYPVLTPFEKYLDSLLQPVQLLRINTVPTHIIIILTLVNTILISVTIIQHISTHPDTSQYPLTSINTNPTLVNIVTTLANIASTPVNISNDTSRLLNSI